MSPIALRRSLTLGSLLIAGCLPALLAHSPNPVAGSGQLLARYVIVGSAEGATVAYARAIIDPGYTCPLVESAGGSTLLMTTRDNTHGFPVIVCEAKLALDTEYSLALGDARFPLPEIASNPTTVHVFGDTGCKSSDCAPGSPAEPFATMAAAAARQAPDLVLHMGDANYRGTPSSVMFSEAGRQNVHHTYDAGDGSTSTQHCEQDGGEPYLSQNERTSNYPDQWPAWRDDFFRPGAPLLEVAPFVIARGNHELCSRAGPGWFYFLDESSNLDGEQLACPIPHAKQSPRTNSVLAEPYAVNLDSLNLIVIDSANACDAFLNRTFAEEYKDQFALLPGLTAPKGTTWMMHHRPLWGVNAYSKDDQSTGCTSRDKHGCINQTLQFALAEALDNHLPPGIDLVLSGHMHRFQSVTFPHGPRPPQIVIGSSGVALDTDSPTGDFWIEVDGEDACVVTTNDTVSHGGVSYPAFGYLAIELSDDGWDGTVMSASGLPLATCGSTLEGASVCQVAGGCTSRH